jgi:hypothetical protein
VFSCACFTDKWAQLADRPITTSYNTSTYGLQDMDWNVTFTNERAYMIDLAAEANIRMMGK